MTTFAWACAGLSVGASLGQFLLVLYFYGVEPCIRAWWQRQYEAAVRKDAPTHLRVLRAQYARRCMIADARKVFDNNAL